MHRSARPVLLLAALLAAALGTLAVLVAPVGSAAPAAPPATWTPPGDTIVRVVGNAEEGFAIHHYDGTALFPPTASEAVAECNEYDTKLARVRCRTGVRIWYRDLADLKDALRYARAS